jgi:hypothetical protein
MNEGKFIARFERLEIPGHEFRHADHIRVAWNYLRRADFAQGAATFMLQFRRYVRHIGAEAKYHETISWFYLVKIHERIRSNPSAPWEDFAHANPDLLDRSLTLLKAHYQPETLGSSFARRVFLLPDHAPARDVSLEARARLSP